MTSELVVVVRCDVCQVEKATQHSVTLDGRSWGIDLCPEHDGELAGVTALLEATGRPEGKSATRAASQPVDSGHPTTSDPDIAVRFRTCPECGHVSSTRQAIGAHTRLHHDSALLALERKHGVKHMCPRCHFTGSFMSLAAHSARMGHSLAEVAR